MKKITFKLFIFILFCLFTFPNLQAQDIGIHLTNPSFEDFARPGQQPRGWYDCGDIMFPLQTPPDTHPSLVNGKPTFGVTQKPFDGDSYLGMVIRETGSYESLGQRLSSKLLTGNSYFFSLSLCMSDTYKSAIRKNNNTVDAVFITPVFLRIWGGNGFCDKSELLAQSPIINNTYWRDFTFLLEPKSDDFSFLTFEIASDIPVNGNLLVDNASTIFVVNVDSVDKVDMALLGDEIKKINDSLKVISKVQRLAEREITVKGYGIKFKNNKLTVSGNRKIRSIANAMKNISDHKLVIDLNGTKNKKAKLKKEELVNVLLDQGLSRLKFEIRNTEKEDNQVKWLVDEDNMYIGILKIED